MSYDHVLAVNDRAGRLVPPSQNVALDENIALPDPVAVEVEAALWGVGPLRDELPVPRVAVTLHVFRSELAICSGQDRPISHPCGDECVGRLLTNTSGSLFRVVVRAVR